MAVDRKADYVGNHGGAYTDMDGMSRQFTVIDHDKKTKIASSKMTDEEKNALKDAVNLAKQQTIDKILALPAISFLKSGNTFAEDCIVRDLEKGIIWDETFVRNMLDIKTEMLLPIWNSVWKNTVKEQYWFDDMSYEDVMAGKWKQLI